MPPDESAGEPQDASVAQQQPSNSADAEQSESAPVQSVESESKAHGEKDGAEPTSNVSEEQWKAMFDVVMAVYEHRESDGHDPSRPFQRSVNKRNVPDYYDVIKEPVALSVLKQKIKNRSYNDFAEFVRDCALIPHNAQTYNRPRSPVYEDSLIVKKVFISEFERLVAEGIISAETAQLPDLGEIPYSDPMPLEEEEEEEEEEDEEEEDEGDESDEEGGRRRRRRAARVSKRDSTIKEDANKTNDPELRKKRGRPPRVDTPMEARIKAVMKGIRKFKDTSGQLKVRHFEKLPDKAVYPDYFSEIKEPMAIDLIKRKSKRKKYNSVDHFMKDVDIMFNNAKQYNQSESQLYKDAEFLQKEAHKQAEEEKKKPDSEYLMEDGRMPLPDGITYKGEVWKVGDWVHLANPNDAAKPIVAQIYRTWQDSDGQQWVNACWYYRPEQTVHQFEKHFFPNEVVKTGQYRDHRIDEVVDRCFVMFFTRYNRGRPRGLPPGKEVYVCEARYNEEKHKLNKIKTWASCLPDEVRERDYEMDLFDAPRKIKKIPSPIKHLLKDNAKETDDVPKPTWGAENAPPIVGAVHRRPREENESPPPEPTPSPPPQPAPAPVAPVAPNKPMPSPQPGVQHHGQNGIRPATPAGVNMPPGTLPKHSPASAQHAPAAPNGPHSMPRMPHPQFQQPHGGAPGTAGHHPARPNNYPPNAPHQFPGYQASQHQQTPHQPHLQPQTQAHPYSAPQNFPSYQGSRVQPQQFPPNTYNPHAPRPVEAFRLPDNIDASIPSDVRSQLQRDENGHVIFFTAPPLDIVAPDHGGLAHSVRYLAAKEERQKRIQERKRKLEEEQRSQEEDAKRQKAEKDATIPGRVENLTTRTIKELTSRLEADTAAAYQAQFGDKAKAVIASSFEHKHRDRSQPEENDIKAPSAFTNLRRSGVFMDDVD